MSGTVQVERGDGAVAVISRAVISRAVISRVMSSQDAPAPSSWVLRHPGVTTASD
jgi:hypothetical protein